VLVRLEQQGWIKGKWDKTEDTEDTREAKYYAITKAGLKALGACSFPESGRP